jgi:hypothetical protein
VKGSIPALPLESAEEEMPDAADAEGQTVEPVATAAPKPPAPAAVAQRPPKGVVVLAIGLPGSGKSSWFKRHNVVPLSSDMVRSLLFDDIREQRFQDLVFSNLRSMLKARLIAKRPMNYVDATNLTPQERQHWIKLAKDYQLRSPRRLLRRAARGLHRAPSAPRSRCSRRRNAPHGCETQAARL